MYLKEGQIIAIKWHADDEECVGQVIGFQQGYCIILTLGGERVPFRESSLISCEEIDPSELELPAKIFWRNMIKRFGRTKLNMFLAFSLGAALLIKYICTIM